MKRVVIIDDEPDSLQIIRDVLEEYTCRVHACATGKEGLRLVSEVKPDLVFLDLRLPDGDGGTFLPEIKEKHPRAKVVIGTAYGSEKIRQHLLSRGADAFFDKPIDINAFEKKVRQLLGTLSEVRMLIIDDESDFSSELRGILEEDNETKWQVAVAGSGEEGLRLVQETMPDLVSLDVCLDTHVEGKAFSSGLAVYRELKRRGFHIPVVVLAATIDSSDAEALNKEGIAAIFSKTELLGLDNMRHFLNVLKRIALRGG